MLAMRPAARRLLAWVASGRFFDLISAARHTAQLERHRLVAIAVRIRLVAGAFSLLTLLWIPFDAATLSAMHWELLAACRALAAAVFILLAIAPDWERGRARVLTMLGITLAIPLAIYGVSQFLLAGIPLHGLAAINSELYRTLPLIVLAGLSIFPLVTSEGLFFAVVISCVVVGIQLALGGRNAIELIAPVLALMFTMGVYLLACAIQLNYMSVLLGRGSHDPLTGALSRRSGVEALDLQFQLARDRGAPLAALFLDVDNFKAINDTFGHHAGDQALEDIAAKLQSLMRSADVVIRWGGEEFVVILTNTPMSGATLVVDRIMNEGLGVRPDGVPITASMGLAERKADDVADWPQLIALADKRMYVAKASGKATCVNHQGVMRGVTRSDAAPSIG